MANENENEQKPAYRLTDEHRAQFKPWCERWIQVAMRTTPQDDQDKAKMRVAMRGLYRSAKLDPPPESRELFCSSPVGGAIASTISAGVWWLRRNPEEAAKLGINLVDDETLELAARKAAEIVVSASPDAPPKTAEEIIGLILQAISHDGVVATASAGQNKTFDESMSAASKAMAPSELAEAVGSTPEQSAAS